MEEKISISNKIKKLISIYSKKTSSQRSFDVFNEKNVTKYADNLNWQLATFQIGNFSYDFIEYFIDDWDWEWISGQTEILTPSFRKRFSHKLYWERIYANVILSEEELKERLPQCHQEWYIVSWQQSLSHEFIVEFKDQLTWQEICADQILSEKTMRQCAQYLIWNEISACQDLSESFIEEFENKLDWVGICSCQLLSERLMRQFPDKLDWESVSACQKFTKKFFFKYYNRMSLNDVRINKYLKFNIEKTIREYEKKNK